MTTTVNEAPAGMRWSPLYNKYIPINSTNVERSTTVVEKAEVVKKVADSSSRIVKNLIGLFFFGGIAMAMLKPSTNNSYVSSSKQTTTYTQQANTKTNSVEDMKTLSGGYGMLIGSAVGCGMDTGYYTEKANSKFRLAFGINLIEAPDSVFETYTAGVVLGTSIISKDTSSTKCDSVRKSLAVAFN